MPDADWHKEQIRQVAGDQIEAMSPTVVVPAMLNYQYGGQWITQQVQLIGIDEKTQGSVSDFGQVLAAPGQPQGDEFRACGEGGYDVRDHQSGPDAPERKQMAEAGWTHRRETARIKQFQQQLPSSRRHAERTAAPAADRPTAGRVTADPFAAHQTAENRFDPEKQQYHRRGAGHRHGELPHADGRRQVPGSCPATT